MMLRKLFYIGIKVITTLFIVICGKQIVANSTSNGNLFYLRQSVCLFVKFCKFLVGSVEVKANLWENTRRSFTFSANIQVLTPHSVHIRRRSAQIRQMPFKIRKLCNFLDLF